MGTCPLPASIADFARNRKPYTVIKPGPCWDMTDTDPAQDPRQVIIDALPQLSAFALRLVRNRASAEDLVQDTFVKVWNGYERFAPGTNLQAWMFTILRHTFYSNLRKARREAEGAELDRFTDYSYATDDQIAIMDFKRALDQLLPEQREALTLIGASGMSYEEAAAVIGVAIGTIKSRVNRGRAKMAELLDGAGAQDPRKPPNKGRGKPGR
jgi:RNA polymerase sigma-70 factor (ECF subfamily)